MAYKILTRIFIDEAGIPGDDGRTYFVLGAVLFHTDTESKICDDRIALLRSELKLPSDYEFKYSSNKSKIRNAFINAVLETEWWFGGYLHRKEMAKEIIENIHPGLLKERAVEFLLWGLEDRMKYAVMVFDKEILRDKNRLIRRLNQRRSHIVDNIVSQDSKLNNLLQLADYIANIIRRKHFNNDNELYNKIADCKIRIPSWNYIT